MEDSPYAVERFSTPAGFLEAAVNFLSASEVENNLILGITMDLAQDASGLMENPYFALVRGPSGDAMAAFQTIPRRIAITRAASPAAIVALARDVDAAIGPIEGILGPEPDVEVFARGLGARRGQAHHAHMRQRIHELVRVVPARSIRGSLRRARDEEEPLLSEWLMAFQQEIGEPAPAARTIGHRMAAGEMFVWDDEGPRSMAGFSGKTPHGIRVNAVYTPPALRGKGYASATVAALSQLLLDRGNRFCCLYTDLANPTSNAIYKRIGYEPVSDSAVFILTNPE